MGKSTVVPHVIKRVRIVEAAVALIDGILGHPRVSIVCFVEEEELWVWLVD